MSLECNYHRQITPLTAASEASPVAEGYELLGFVMIHGKITLVR
ncbi:hypothetical protein VPAL9027_02083 [Vibrio palustris]|uniref:Uncharacterized protein n=1 Tax=Vibrio palustris TaxID=1918946 RepID=A0A1R4B599_9VIBR|nr:hypothetical protein [Vibrio palustris]SJL84102.1 hypothetical protein VPAL9027_02083 [Vibrio palustris]